MRNNKMKGFTLVELLVVIAILAILATVSVVGYTSFIKSAHISNDENIAAQLNQFLAAYQADHTTEHYGKPITEDNIWEITQTILKDSQLDELEPHAKDYGYHYYFKFDGQGGGQYVAADENTLRISAFTRVVRFFVSADTPKSNYAGVFYDEADNKYFLCDTKGSPIAEAIKGFHTFKDITGESTAEQFANFKTLVNGLNEELYGSLKTLAASGVFVTKEGNFAFDRNAEHSNLFFHEDATYVGNVIKDTAGEKPLGETDYLLTINEDTTLTIPTGVKLPANSLNISVADGKNVTVKLDASAWTNELKDIVDAYFTNDNVTVVVGDKEYKINGNYIYDATKYNPAAPADHVDTLKYNNSLQDFDIEILDENDNQLLNGSKLVGEETIKAGFAAWDKGSFKLQLANVEGKNDTAISSLAVKWEVLSGPATIAQDGTVTFTGDYSLNHDKIVVSATSIIDRNGYTSASSKFDANNVAYAEYTIYIAGPQGYTVTVNGKTYAPVDANAAIREYNVTLVKTSETSDKFGFTYTFANNSNVIDGVSLNYGDITATYTCTDHAEHTDECCNHDCNTEEACQTACTHTEHTAECAEGCEIHSACDLTCKLFGCKHIVCTTDSITVKEACSGGVLTINVANYLTFKLNISVFDASDLAVIPKNPNTIVVGNLNEISMSDLFKTRDGGDFPAGAELRVYNSVVTTGTTADTYMKPNRTLMPNTATDEDGDSNGTWVSKNIAGVNETIRFYGNTTTSDVTFAVFLNGVRISEDVIATEIVEAYNINDYTDIATAETNSASMVLLNNITVATNTSADEVITVKGGKTLYGNYYTINLPAPVAGSFSRDYSYIRLEGATMLNTKVVGTIYDSLSLSAWANDGKGKNAVLALSGSTIENCYIANTRSPLVSGSASDTATNKVIVKNSVLFGGRYCNVDLRGGTLEFQGDVITVNQPVGNVVGMGVVVWLNAPPSTNIKVTGTWTPYNFMERGETSALPKYVQVSTTRKVGDSDIKLDIGMPLQKMFGALFGECTKPNHDCAAHKNDAWYKDPCCNNVLHQMTGTINGNNISWVMDWVHNGVTQRHQIDTTHRQFIFTNITDKEYVNAAVVSMNDVTVVPTTTTSQPYSFTSTTYVIDMYLLDFKLGVATLAQNDANKALLANGRNAATTYAPANYGFVSGDLAPLTSN